MMLHKHVLLGGDGLEDVPVVSSSLRSRGFITAHVGDAVFHRVEHQETMVASWP